MKGQSHGWEGQCVVLRVAVYSTPLPTSISFRLRKVPATGLALPLCSHVAITLGLLLMHDPSLC